MSNTNRTKFIFKREGLSATFEGVATSVIVESFMFLNPDQQIYVIDKMKLILELNNKNTNVNPAATRG